MVCRQYDEPIHLFDAHLYEKGGRVLHMLRHELGDGPFWRAIGHYARKHARGSVETRDLARAIEEVTGRGVEQMLDRWIARPGHPALEGRWSWDEERKVGTLALAQKQEVTPETPLFELSATVRFELDGGARDERVIVREATHNFEFKLPARPTQVIFDPGDVLLKTIKLDKNAALWRRQLTAAELGIDRVLAARALGDLPDPANVAAADRGARRRSLLGRSRRRRPRPRPHPARRGARRADRAPSTRPSRACGGRSPLASASSPATRRPGARSRPSCEPAIAASSSRPRSRSRSDAPARRWPSSCCRRWSIARRSRPCWPAAPSRGSARPATSGRSR